MPSIEIGAIDPVSIFGQQLANVLELTRVFTERGNVRPIDYLRAVQMARENIDAIVMVTFTSIMSECGDQVPEDIMRDHLREVTDNQPTTEEERMERMHRALHRVAKHITINTDDTEENRKKKDEGGD